MAASSTVGRAKAEHGSPAALSHLALRPAMSWQRWPLPYNEVYLAGTKTDGPKDVRDHHLRQIQSSGT